MFIAIKNCLVARVVASMNSGQGVLGLISDSDKGFTDYRVFFGFEYYQ